MKTLLILAATLLMTQLTHADARSGSDTVDCTGRIGGVNGVVTLVTYPLYTCWQEDPDLGPAGCGNVPAYKILVGGEVMSDGFQNGRSGVDPTTEFLTFQLEKDTLKGKTLSQTQQAFFASLEDSGYGDLNFVISGARGGSEMVQTINDKPTPNNFQCDPTFASRAMSGQF